VKLFDLFLFVLENLQRQRGRVLLTSLGVTIGSAAIILLVALISGLQQIATAQDGSNTSLTRITMKAGFGRFTGGGNVRTNNSTSTQLSITNDVIGQFAGLEHVVRVIPTQSVQGEASLSFQRFTGRANITGVAVDDVALLGDSTAEGTTALETGKVVIGAEVPGNVHRANDSGSNASLTANLLNKSLQLTLSKTGSGGIQHKVFRLQVVGILAATGSQSDYAIYISMNDADAMISWVNGERVNHNTGSFSGAIIEVDDTDYVMAVAETITNLGYQAMTPNRSSRTSMPCLPSCNWCSAGWGPLRCWRRDPYPGPPLPGKPGFVQRNDQHDRLCGQHPLVPSRIRAHLLRLHRNPLGVVSVAAGGFAAAGNRAEKRMTGDHVKAVLDFRADMKDADVRVVDNTADRGDQRDVHRKGDGHAAVAVNTASIPANGKSTGFLRLLLAHFRCVHIRCKGGGDARRRTVEIGGKKERFATVRCLQVSLPFSRVLSGYSGAGGGCVGRRRKGMTETENPQACAILQ
jgi:hypothetical protein